MGIGYCWLNRLVSDFLYKKENGDLKMDVTKIIGLIGTIGVIRGAFLAYEGWQDRTAAGDEPMAKKKATNDMIGGIVLMGVSVTFAAAVAAYVSGALKF